MDADRERRYLQLSPFELRKELLTLAERRAAGPVLNAARGNPNWIALEPRVAFLRLLELALEESGRFALAPGLGAARLAPRIAAQFEAFVRRQSENAGVRALARYLDYAEHSLGIGREGLLQELAGATLGDHYPTPPRMLPLTECILRAFLKRALLAPAADDDYELFAVEGASAGVAYLFDSLFEAKLLAKGDKIALGVPIFTPYLEIAALNDYELLPIEIRQDEKRGWHTPPQEIERVRDPTVKALLLVNPSNPTAISLDAATLEAIAALVRTERPDLMVITDDVYATFAPGFVSLAALIPHNTVLIDSCSKFWGTTGWRLGVLALHRDNVFDERIRAMDEAVQTQYRARYRSIAVEPERLNFIDRLAADSRRVGFNHTAGLSTPQQAQMALCALQYLADADGRYARAARELIERRSKLLYVGAGMAPREDPCCTHYYATIDIAALGRRRYGSEFADWLTASFSPIDFVVRLAEEKGIVLLDGGGFHAPAMSVRVSLANLPDESYPAIGRGISELLEDYHAAWQRRRA